MSEPRTEAGKRLLASTLTDNDPDALRRTILAIEAEAAADGDLTTAYMVGYEKGKAAASPSTDTSTALRDVGRLARAIHVEMHDILCGPNAESELLPPYWTARARGILATLSVTPQDTTE